VTSQSRGLSVKRTGTCNNHWKYTYTRVLWIKTNQGNCLFYAFCWTYSP